MLIVLYLHIYYLNYTVDGDCKNCCRTRTMFLEENDITNAQWGFIWLNILSNKK